MCILIIYNDSKGSECFTTIVTCLDTKPAFFSKKTLLKAVKMADITSSSRSDLGKYKNKNKDCVFMITKDLIFGIKLSNNIKFIKFRAGDSEERHALFFFYLNYRHMNTNNTWIKTRKKHKTWLIVRLAPKSTSNIIKAGVQKKITNIFKSYYSNHIQSNQIQIKWYTTTEVYLSDTWV